MDTTSFASYLLSFKLPAAYQVLKKNITITHLVDYKSRSDREFTSEGIIKKETLLV